MNEALNDFQREYGGCVYPHREELASILQSGRFRDFTSHWPSSLDCAHYARTFAIRAEAALRRATPLHPEIQEISRQCRALADELSKTPNLPCRLFCCVTDTRTIGVYVRPDLPERGASLSLPVSSTDTNAQ